MSQFALLRVEEIRLRPGEEWTESTARWRLARVVNGAAYWLGAAQRRALNEGELLVVPTGVTGVVRASQLGEVVLQGFAFAPEALRALLTSGERRFFESPEVCWEAQFLPSTHPLAQRFAVLAASNGAQGELTRRAAALALVAEVLDEQRAQHVSTRAVGVDARQRFEQLTAQMPHVELIQQTVAGLARLCGCSPRHFSRMFHRRFGESVRTRQTELRLLRAQELLGTTQEKISAVALASGYRNVGLFNLLFKRRFGLTPSEYREQAREAAEGGRKKGEGSAG